MLVLRESSLKLSYTILILAVKQMAMSSINKEELLSPIHQGFPDHATIGIPKHKKRQNRPLYAAKTQ